VEVRRPMLLVEHPDDDAEESRDDRHTGKSYAVSRGTA
jgi:hypothetical protein